MTRSGPLTTCDRLSADLVVVGSGAAGLTVAAEVAPRTVTLVTRSGLGQSSSTGLAQGGVAVALDGADSPSRHADDTFAVGGGLNDPLAVELLTTEGPRLLRRLLDQGARFERSNEGTLALSREAGHSRRRVVRAGGDATGAELVRLLVDVVRATPTVHALTHTQARGLLVDDAGRVRGILVRTAQGRWVSCMGRAVVLATGGIGGLYRYTTNPPDSTGDGLAMAAVAGARLADLEFVQFHPTVLDVGTHPMPLLTEALRGEGAVIVDETGARFLSGPTGELAPRDVLARAVWRHREAGHEVLLDLRPISGVSRRFPTVHTACHRHGLDPSSQPLPISPAAHYHMGGVAVDAYGQTSLPGLWACGEVACTGVHGANRLGSNSLLEALVFGSRLARDLADCELPPPLVSGGAELATSQGPVRPLGGARDRTSGSRGRACVVMRELRHIMWQRVGLLRDARGLAEADHRLGELAEVAGSPESGPILVARLIAAAALARCESRGAHKRADHPGEDEAWQRRLYVTLAPTGQPRVVAGPRLEEMAA
ncbi:MAG: L-aspartate oxidase [Nitriliruptorales bacterium]